MRSNDYNSIGEFRQSEEIRPTTDGIQDLYSVASMK
jgi:hypothetical protein